MHSALKKDGRALYEYARAGIEVERQPRRVTIARIEVIEFDGARLVIDVACSKGTYIRALADDIGLPFFRMDIAVGACDIHVSTKHQIKPLRAAVCGIALHGLEKAHFRGKVFPAV